MRVNPDCLFTIKNGLDGTYLQKTEQGLKVSESEQPGAESIFQFVLTTDGFKIKAVEEGSATMDLSEDFSDFYLDLHQHDDEGERVRARVTSQGKETRVTIEKAWGQQE